MIALLRLLILVLLEGYFVWALVQAWNTGQVQHRWYLSENKKTQKYATREQNPVEYWTVVSMLAVFAVLCGWPILNALLTL